MKPNFNPWNTLENLFWMSAMATVMYFFAVKPILKEQQLYRMALIEMAKIEKYKIQYDQSNAKIKARGEAKNDMNFQADLPVLNSLVSDSLNLDSILFEKEEKFWQKIKFWN